MGFSIQNLRFNSDHRVASWLVRIITNLVIKKILTRIVEKSRFHWDDIALKTGVFRNLVNLIPALFLWNMMFFALPDESESRMVVQKAVSLWILYVFARILISVIDTFHVMYKRRPSSAQHPIKGVLQAVKIVILVALGLIGIASITGNPISGVLGGLGAISAVIMLIFKDPILGLVSGFQLVANDMVSIGDWIEVPAYEADGDVIDIGLQTLTVQNWDKTYSTILVSDLLSGTFKNWKGMTQAGGRRIKRSISLNMNSIRFLTNDETKELENIHILKPYLTQRKDEILKSNKSNNIDEQNNESLNGRHMTNIGVFRAYVSIYLKSHPFVRQDLTLLVRQLPPGPKGLPLEIYVFSNDLYWGNFENIQSDIFDHLLASLSRFGLKVFLEPTGLDFAELQ